MSDKWTMMSSFVLQMVCITLEIPALHNIPLAAGGLPQRTRMILRKGSFESSMPQNCWQTNVPCACTYKLCSNSLLSIRSIACCIDDSTGLALRVQPARFPNTAIPSIIQTIRGSRLVLRGGAKKRKSRTRSTEEDSLEEPHSKRRSVHASSTKRSSVRKKPAQTDEYDLSSDNDGNDEGDSDGDGSGNGGDQQPVSRLVLARRQRNRERRRRLAERARESREAAARDALARARATIAGGEAIRARYRVKGGAASTAARNCTAAGPANATAGTVRVTLPSGVQQTIPLDWVESVLPPPPPPPPPPISTSAPAVDATNTSAAAAAAAGAPAARPGDAKRLEEIARRQRRRERLRRRARRLRLRGAAAEAAQTAAAAEKEAAEAAEKEKEAEVAARRERRRERALQRQFNSTAVDRDKFDTVRRRIALSF
jgi:hypothetical protein